MRQMRFTVMRIHSDYLSKFALTLIGYPDTNKPPIVPRYLDKSYDEQALRNRADMLNDRICAVGKLLSVPKRESFI